MSLRSQQHCCFLGVLGYTTATEVVDDGYPYVTDIEQIALWVVGLDILDKFDRWQWNTGCHSSQHLWRMLRVVFTFGLDFGYSRHGRYPQMRKIESYIIDVCTLQAIAF